MNKTNIKDCYYVVNDCWADAREAFVSVNCSDYNGEYGGYYVVEEFESLEEAEDFCRNFNSYEGIEGRYLNCCSGGCHMDAFDYAHWNGKCAFTGNFEEEEEEVIPERETRIKRKRYLREKKRLKRAIKDSKILKENKAYKKAWLNKHKTAIYSHGFHPAWGEPIEVSHGHHGCKWVEEVVPLFFEVGEDTKTLPFKEHKIAKTLIPLIISNTWFAVSNSAP